MDKKIRFGVMSKNMTLAKWQVDAIQNVLNLEGTSLELLILDRDKPKSFLREIIDRRIWRNFFWNVFMYVILPKFKSNCRIDISQKFGATEKVSCSVPLKGKFSGYFSKEDTEVIKARNLDFILRFYFGDVKGEILNVPKYGVWTFHHNDEQKYRGGPPCFWSIYNDDFISSAMLQRMTGNPEVGIILKKGTFKTMYSYIKNRDQLYTECSKWPALICTDLLNGDTEYLSLASSVTPVPTLEPPGNWQFVKYILTVHYYKIRKLFRLFFYVDFWNIGIAKCHISEFLKDEKPEIEWFPLNTKEVFIADPFAIADTDNPSRLHLFFETFNFRKKKGYIEYACYDSGFSKPVIVIEENTHMSYPYIIEQNGEIMLNPANFDTNTVRLYKAKKFPLEWEKSTVVLDGFSGADNTIIRKDGINWMFTSNTRDGVYHNLMLFYSDTLDGQWTPHPKNPVKTDIRSSRCAGTPFIHDNALYRPSMDYSEKKQGRIVLNKISRMSMTEFSETAVKTIEPYRNSPFPDKIHTLSSAGNFTVIDGAREEFILSNPVFLKFKIEKLLEGLHLGRNINHLLNRIAGNQLQLSPS